MKTARQSIPSPSDASGFVLVGVVMFILVLTMLGLSLFSLSGFEAQFFNASLHRQDSYYIATGGVERARWVLMRTERLKDVDNDMPEGVTYTEARQGGATFDDAPVSMDEDAEVDWEGGTVWIRVKAEKRGMKTFIEAQFDPTEPEQIYKRVVTSYTGITAITSHGGTPRYTTLSGAVWQNSSDLTWQAINGGPWPVVIGGAPMPDVAGFFAAYLSGARNADLVSGTVLTVNLNEGAPGSLTFYRTDGFLTHSVQHGIVHLNVQGTAVWMLPDGIEMRNRIYVNGGPSDRLIIVARRQPAKDVGISFDTFADYPSSGPPVFLVTDSALEFTNEWNYETEDTKVPYITMFAKSVTLKGGETGKDLKLTHDSNLDDAVLEPLYDAKALPNTLSGVTRTLTLQTGTWRQLPTTGL